VLKFGPIIARNSREKRPKPYTRWHLDEMAVSIAGRQMYMWRAVDSEGEVLEILVQPQRDKVNIRPAEILMVAAHNYDLNAANEQGFGRPSEKGPAGSPGNQPDPSFQCYELH
jgi:DDE domain